MDNRHQKIDSFCVDYRAENLTDSLPDYNYEQNIDLDFGDEAGNSERNKGTLVKKNISKKPRLFKSVVSLMICIALTVLFVNSFSISIFDDAYEENFNDFILPVVMNDPDPFNSIDELDLDKVLSCAMWYTALFQNDRHYTNYDESGRVLIPVEDVSTSASALFGSNYKMPIENPKTKSFFELDCDKKNYLIKPISNDESYVPKILSERIVDKKIYLKVGYFRPKDPFDSKSSSESQSVPEKIMEYVLEKDEKTAKMYIKQIIQN